MHETSHNILEPEQSPDTNIQAPSLDIVIVPMVGFDKHCSRIGSGFGCYDRSFEFLVKKHLKKPVLVGIAYYMQQLETIEVNPWDVPMDYVITETGCHQK